VIVLLSGEIAVGKTTIAADLATELGGIHLRVRQALAQIVGVPLDDREALQREGAELDARTRGRWLRNFVEETIAPCEAAVIDSLRTRRQTIPLLGLPDSHLIHLTADLETRRRRYREAAGTDALKARVPFERATAHETERLADALRDLAELVVPTEGLSVREVCDVILDHLGITRGDA